MFDRLLGLETEYALRFQPLPGKRRRVSNGSLFERLVNHVRSRVPIASAVVKEFGWFTANGGALRFERNPFFPFLASAGVMEGATPECRSPRQLLRYQRAQDVLLSWAAAKSGEGDACVTLVKHNHDSRGVPYGSHENYEATIATGAGLLLWRLGLIFVFIPFMLPLIAAIVVFFLVTLTLSAPVLIVCRCIGRGHTPPKALDVVLHWVGALCVLPVLLPAEGFVRLAAFRRVRKRLLAFLVSRPVIAGSGAVDSGGRFTLSPRALAVSSLCCTAAELSRPVFYFGHVWKGIIFGLFVEPARFLSLFRSRQRLQIAVGDSNMTQMAEYLKIGTTLLVLDAIEAGELDDAPVLRRPLRALRKICADPELQTTVSLTDGRQWTALEIQRFYLDACRIFVDRTPEAHAEAREILRLWQLTLDALEQDSEQLVGKLDWVTKRYLLKSAAEGASLEAKRKLDLRYHEISAEGYYVKLEASGSAPTLVEPEEIMSAIQIPPEGTPAARRGQLIRMLAGSGKDVAADWNSVRIRSKSETQVIRLGDAGGFEPADETPPLP